MEIKQQYFEVAFDFEHFFFQVLKDFKDTNNIAKRKAKVAKPINTEFTDIDNNAQDEAQIVLNQNFINLFLYDFLFYDNLFSVNWILDFFT